MKMEIMSRTHRNDRRQILKAKSYIGTASYPNVQPIQSKVGLWLIVILAFIAAGLFMSPGFIF